MAVYLVVTVLVLFFSLLAEQQNYPRATWAESRRSSQLARMSLFIIAVILVFVAGFRYDVGTDYLSYAWHYPSYVANVWQEILEFDEPGIKVIAWLASKIHDDYATMFLLTSAITIGLSVVTIMHNTPNFCIALLMYLFMGNWHGSFNAVRQCFAAAIIFAGHRYIIERKFFKYCLVVFLAMCFHKSAIVMLLPYFIARNKFNYRNTFLLAMGAIIILYSYDNVYEFVSLLKSEEITMDSASYMSTSVNIFRILVALAPAAMLFFFAEFNSNDTEYNFYVNMIILHGAAMVAASSSAYLARIGIYTSIFSTIAFPKVFLKYRAKNNVLFVRMMSCLYFIYWIYEISISSKLYNFQWIFTK